MIKKVREKDIRVGKERLYKLLTSPVLTEKSTQGSEQNKYTFNVSLDAKKPEIKKAVETLFKVKVKSVNTLLQKGKTKRFRGVMGTRVDRKKAVVTLVEGSSIDMTTGI